ncbi:MAG: ABC transporter permease [Chromatiales bacterium]
MGAPARGGRARADLGLGRVSVAMRNLRRSLFRSLAIGAAMALMAGSLLAIVATLQVVQSGVTRGAGKLGPDIVVVRRGAPRTPGPESAASYLDYSAVEEISAVEVIVPQYGGKPPLHLPGVAAVSAQLSLWLESLPWAGGRAVQLIGFEPETDLTVRPWVREGLAKPMGPGEALAGHSLGQLLHRDIEMAGERFAVVGVLDRTGTAELDRSVFVDLPVAWKLAERVGAGLPDGEILRPVTRVMVRARPEFETQRVANFIRSTVPDVDARLSDRALTALGTQMRLSVGNLVLIAGAIWLTALLLVGSAYSMVVRERQREIGLLRAMGATRGGIFAMVSLEILAVCTAGGVLGVALTLGALAAVGGAVGDLSGLAWTSPDPERMLGLGLLCVLAAPATGLLAAFAPTLRAVSLEPHAAIQDAP